MKKLVVLLTLIGFSGAALSDVMVGVNFSGPSNDGGYKVLDPATQAGVVSQGNWMNAPWSPDLISDLTDSTGANTGIQLASNFINDTKYRGVLPLDGTSGNNILMNGYASAPGSEGDAIITLSGALGTGAFATYDVYVYLGAPAGRNGSVTDGTTTKYFTNSGVTDYGSGFAEITSTTESSPTAGSYAMFSGSGTDDFVLTVDALTGKWTETVYVHGIQVVGTSVVPEPATLGLIAMSSCGILVIRRRFMI